MRNARCRRLFPNGGLGLAFGMVLLAVILAGPGSSRIAVRPALASGAARQVTQHPVRYMTCSFPDGAVVSDACARLRDQSVAHAQAHASSTAASECDAQPNNITRVAAADDGVLSSQLDEVEPNGKGKGDICYFFWGSNGSGGNHFDFDDDWQVFVRVWVCGKLKQLKESSGDQASGTAGPPAQVGSAIWNYGRNCNPQADNNKSYAMVDYVQHYFPYVRFDGP